MAEKMFNPHPYNTPMFWNYKGVDAENYEFTANLIKEVLLEENPKDFKLLDLGCGDGRLTIELAEIVNSVVGIDIVEKGIAFAKKLASRENIEYKVMNATNLKFKNNSFDAVVANGLIEYIPKEKTKLFLSEARRVLKKDGVFVLTAIMPSDKQLKKEKNLTLYKHEQLLQLFEEAGFKVEKRFGIFRQIFVKRFSRFRNWPIFKSIFRWQIKSAKNFPEKSRSALYKLRAL